MSSLSQTMKMVWLVARSKPVVIRMWGGAYEYYNYQYFTKRHRRWPVIQQKNFGAALFRLPPPDRPLFSGKQFQAARTNQTRAIKAGHSFRAFDAPDQIDAILAINRSSDLRQNRRMVPEYLDREAVKANCSQPGRWFGVFDHDDCLKAYCHMLLIGEVAIFSRLLGHHDSLADGIMWLLVCQTIHTFHTMEDIEERPPWVMYDTYIGGRDGLREFKTRIGFRPYRVHWQWCDRNMGRLSPMPPAA